MLSRMALAVLDSEPVAVTDDELNAALQLHRLKVDGHSQLSDAFRAGFRYARRTTPQPAPVVPDDVLAALQKVARIRLDLNDFDGDRRGIADCLGDAEEALIEVINRRAAMLQAGTLTNEGTIQAESQNVPQNIHEIIPGWIPVSERIPIPGVDVLVAKEFFGPGDWRRKVGHVRHEDSGWDIYGASWEPTHWMPLPAPPTEVK
ncbi:TPA: DUF551 domain-containing protein [Klebsiella pneumoniae]|nr:DUF551 domain-containing protein [Klebsiella pneumoniae]